jgi:hypothetical protein
MPDIVQVTVNTKIMDLFRFMIFHAYSKVSGMVTLVFSIVSLFMLPVSIFVWKDNFVTLAFALLVVLYLIITPLNMLAQARRQVRSNPVFKNPITYHISEEILEVQQYTGTARLFWNQLIRVKKTPFDYLFYVNKEQAFVMPKTDVDKDDIVILDAIIEKVKAEVGTRVSLVNKENVKSRKDKREKVDVLEKQLMEIASKDGIPVEDKSETEE